MEAADTEEDAMEEEVDMVAAATAVEEDTEEAVMEAVEDTEEEEMEAVVEDMEEAAATNSINVAIGLVPLVVLDRSVLLLCLNCTLLFSVFNSAILKVPSSSETL